MIRLDLYNSYKNNVTLQHDQLFFIFILDFR